MNPVRPRDYANATHVEYARDQPEYQPLPACVTPTGEVVTEWKPTAEELALLMNGGRVRLIVATFGRPLQPVMLDVLEDPREMAQYAAAQVGTAPCPLCLNFVKLGEPHVCLGHDA